MPKKELSPTPILTEATSTGIPERYAEYAKRTKQAVWDNKTVFDAYPRSEEVPVLPPNISRLAFNTAIAELRSALGGAEHVELNDKPLEDGWYMEQPNTHDVYSIVNHDDLVSSAMAYPGSVEDVQAIVRWANKHLIPIYPISMGRNFGYGGAAPRVRGSVIVDLGKRMNRVLEIDATNYACLLEPGVSYFKLHEAIQKAGYGGHLWIDPPDLGGGSVMGNALDRGVGYTPYGDHFGQHCGMEIVLPNGEIYRTGMGAMTGSNAWQLFPYGFGPYADGIFTQSNFGIVTKMGMWLMPDPGGHQSYLVTFPRQEDFEDIVEIIRPLRIKNILGNVPQLRHVTSELATSGVRADYYKGEAPMPLDIIQKAAQKLATGPCSWVFYGTLYGPPEIRDYYYKIIQTEFGKIKGARFFLPQDLPPSHYLNSRVNVCAGVPELRELQWLNWVPNGAHLFFAPISPTTAKDAKRLLDICYARHAEFHIDPMPAFCIGAREMHLIDNVVYNRYDATNKANAHKMVRAMIDDAAKEGYGEYRTHLLLQDQVMGTYGWNNNIHRRFNEALKDALDPNGILAPGKSGIWPKDYRGKGWELGKYDGGRPSAPSLNTALPAVLKEIQLKGKL